ncbi:haloalkane dehalogenase 2 [Mycobacterium marinum]|uniref:alpha/beta fold hydrolase n=1 Tax=Mycobacterium marinum TaxID=1781 RepID=UPI0021C45D48|nr:alpha/beta fold hydrolase [Mycobacterium marinum]GJO95560.1 haloalkane dehalogenase 2 [Mycobacterium marinum]
MTRAQVARLLEQHRASGRRFTAAGIESFVLDSGARDAPPVICVHGVPALSFLYRKVVAALAQRGLRGIAIDLPGLGLAERPGDADYTWSGLGRWLGAAIDALGIGRFHLVVHDIGGPIGFDVANAAPDRVLSMTLLNTIIAVERFHRPWPMEPFAHRAVGEMWLALLRVPGAFESIMRLVGVSSRVPSAEIACWKPLLFGDDGGRAFLEIMRGFELTPEKQHNYIAAVQDTRYPVQIVWGVRDTMLSWRRYGAEARQLAGTQRVTTLPAKHFLQEDFPEEIAAAVQRLAQSS